jgi:gamma-glutamylputrescine oxidase
MSTARPVWDDDAPAEIFRDALPAQVDVAVVGAGLAGLSAAYHAKERTPEGRVAVLEAGRIGAGASGRSTGMVGPGVAQSLSALAQRVGDDAARALYGASLEAVHATRRLVEREGIDCALENGSQLVVARSRADRQRLRADAGVRTRLGVPHEALDDRALRARLRVAAAGGGDADGPAAIAVPDTAIVHPRKLVLGLARAVRAHGGLVCEGTRVTRVTGGGPGTPVTLTVVRDGRPTTLVARRMVAAAGGGTPGLGLLRGRVLPLHVQALATAPLPADVRDALGWRGREGVVGASRVFDYFRLTADDRLVFGGGVPRYAWNGGSSPGGEARALARLEAALRRRFADVPGMARVPVTHRWTGLIDYVLDGLPAIGARRDRPGVLHLVGWCGHGLALSIAAGAWVSAGLGPGLSSPLPPLRDRPPLVPTEVLRWLVCRSAIAAMAFRDRLDRMGSASPAPATN